MGETEGPGENKPKRRVRYAGTHPRNFGEKYKELNHEKYSADVEKVMARGQTPAGMHRSICVAEILAVLNPRPGEIGLDATLGFGGHSKELLAKILPGGKLFATDVDPLELPRTSARLRALGYGEDVFFPHQLNFASIPKLLPEVPGHSFDFILADLGVSSMQIDDPNRGFTFKYDGPLDLRLNPSKGKSAAEFLAASTREDLEAILIENADEPFASNIAAGLMANQGRIKTTLQYAEVIKRSMPRARADDKDLQTKTLQRCFQALRIAVNNELAVLDQLLRNLPLALKPGGRVAILTFHSGEDKRVCEAFAQGLQSSIYSAWNEEAIRPSSKERYDNPRSKSARLRWAIRAL